MGSFGLGWSGLCYSRPQPKEEEDFRKIAEIAVQGPSRTAYENESDGILRSIYDSFVENTMAERLIARVNVRNVNRVSAVQEMKPLEAGHYNCMISEVASKTRHSGHTPKGVSRKFNIGIERAKKTIKVTTHKRNSSCCASITPSISCIPHAVQSEAAQWSVLL